MARAKDIVTRARIFGVVLAAVASTVTACAAPSAPGMVVVESSRGSSGPGSMLVAFPKTACTGSDSAVFLDERGDFIGAVAPGTATYLEFPPGAAKLFVVSSADIVAPQHTRFVRHAIERPGQRVERGIVVEVPRADTRTCYRAAPPVPTVVTYAAATRAAKDQQWLDVRQGDPRAGSVWLDQHRARVDELVDHTPAPPPGPVVTSVLREP